MYFFLRFYLFIHERHRERHRQREKQAPCRKPIVGLDSRTLGSLPEQKADAQPLSHPGIPVIYIFKNILRYISVYILVNILVFYDSEAVHLGECGRH